MADPNNPQDGHGPRKVHLGPANEGGGLMKWLPWLLLALGLLALLFALSRCGNDEEAAPPVANTAPVEDVTPTPVAPAAPAGVSQVGSYLGGTEPAPRSFVFEKLNFDTASAAIRPADREELTQVAGVLQQYPNARVRVTGFADARGSEPANAQLGQQRADAVKAALTQAGIAGERIETASGGEGTPADTNATASGRAENRRTELAVTQR